MRKARMTRDFAVRLFRRVEVGLTEARHLAPSGFTDLGLEYRDAHVTVAGANPCQSPICFASLYVTLATAHAMALPSESIAESIQADPIKDGLNPFRATFTSTYPNTKAIASAATCENLLLHRSTLDPQNLWSWLMQGRWARSSTEAHRNVAITPRCVSSPFHGRRYPS